MYLFKYFEPARLDVIKNGCIRLTQPLDFNDPFEFKPVISTIASQQEFDDILDENIDKGIEKELFKYSPEIRSLMPRNKIEAFVRSFIIDNKSMIDNQLKQAAKKMSEIFHNKSNELIGVLCLAEMKDNLLMWSHYADSHKGFCIKFDASNEFFNRKRSEKDEFYHLRKVVYLEKRPNKMLTNMSGVDLLLHKSNVWAYEEEWRFCGVLKDADQIIESKPLNIHLFKFPEKSVKEIILGVNSSKKLEQELRLILAEKSELSHVKLSKAKISEEQYSLEFYEL